MKLKEECIQNYEGKKMNCIVTKVTDTTFDATILGLGITMVDIPANKYNPKYCMPDNVNTQQEHEQYLKDIGHEEYVKKLKHFQDCHIGLWATDKPIEDLLHLFWNRSLDACPLEASEAEKQEAEFKDWIKNISWQID